MAKIGRSTTDGVTQAVEMGPVLIPELGMERRGCVMLTTSVPGVSTGQGKYAHKHHVLQMSQWHNSVTQKSDTLGNKLYKVIGNIDFGSLRIFRTLLFCSNYSKH